MNHHSFSRALPFHNRAFFSALVLPLLPDPKIQTICARESNAFVFYTHTTLHQSHSAARRNFSFAHLTLPTAYRSPFERSSAQRKRPLLTRPLLLLINIHSFPRACVAVVVAAACPPARHDRQGTSRAQRAKSLANPLLLDNKSRSSRSSSGSRRCPRSPRPAATRPRQCRGLSRPTRWGPSSLQTTLATCLRPPVPAAVSLTTTYRQRCVPGQREGVLNCVCAQTINRRNAQKLAQFFGVNGEQLEEAAALHTQVYLAAVVASAKMSGGGAGRSSNSSNGMLAGPAATTSGGNNTSATDSSQPTPLLYGLACCRVFLFGMSMTLFYFWAG